MGRHRIPPAGRAPGRTPTEVRGPLAAEDQRVLADLGWELELELEEIVDRFVGRSEADFTDALEAQLGRELGEGWDRKYEPWYRSAFDRELAPVDGVVAALDGLRIPHCGASSGSHAKMRRTLGQTGLLPRFEGRILSATEVARVKPAPDLFLHAAGTPGRPRNHSVLRHAGLARPHCVRTALKSGL
ncbi:HAD family hydrolase [Micrococcaceae bacterium Sec5.8]